MITVLLADDHIMVRDGLRYILEAAGDIEIIALASNGKEAVTEALKRCPNIAVIDISMPVMDGIEATKQILEMCPHTRIVTLSMYHTEEYVKRALRAGAFGYVLKDAAGNELVKAVRSLHAGKRYFSRQVAKYDS
ncbi:MAG TPA: response regulator transcription factor [Anaerolineales bacterium]